MKTYARGVIVESGDKSQAALFVGYDSQGNEYWCDLVDEESGFICPPERKTFEGSEHAGLIWSQSIEDFAEAVDHEIPCEKETLQ